MPELSIDGSSIGPYAIVTDIGEVPEPILI
jgi:hypothetical protein